MKQRNNGKDTTTKNKIKKFILFKKNEDIVLDTLIKSRILKDPILKNSITLHEIIMNLKKINNALIEKTKQAYSTDIENINVIHRNTSIKSNYNKKDFAHPFDSLHYGKVNNTLVCIRNKENKTSNAYKLQKSKVVKKKILGLLDIEYNKDIETDHELCSHLNKSLDNYFKKYFANKNTHLKDCAKCNLHKINRTSSCKMDLYNNYVDPLQLQKYCMYEKNSPFHTEEMHITSESGSLAERSLSNNNSSSYNKIKELCNNWLYFGSLNNCSDNIKNYNWDDIQSLCSFKSVYKMNMNKDETKPKEQINFLDDTTIESHRNCLYSIKCNCKQRNDIISRLESNLRIDKTKKNKGEEYIVENYNDITKQTKKKHTLKEIKCEEQSIQILDILKDNEMVTKEKETNKLKNIDVNELEIANDVTEREQESYPCNTEDSSKEQEFNKIKKEITSSNNVQNKNVEKGIKECSNVRENILIAKPMKQVVAYQTFQMTGNEDSNTLHNLLSNVYYGNEGSIKNMLNINNLKSYRNKNECELSIEGTKNSIHKQKIDTIVLREDNILIKKKLINLSNYNTPINRKTVSYKKEQLKHNKKLSYEQKKLQILRSNNYRNFKRIKKINKYTYLKREKLNRKLIRKCRKKRYLFYLLEKIKLYDTIDLFKRIMHQIKKCVWKNEHIKQNKSIKCTSQDSQFTSKHFKNMSKIKKKKIMRNDNYKSFDRTNNSKPLLFQKNFLIKNSTCKVSYAQEKLDTLKNTINNMHYTNHKHRKKKKREVINLNNAEFLIQALIDKIDCDKIRQTYK